MEDVFHADLREVTPRASEVKAYGPSRITQRVVVRVRLDRWSGEPDSHAQAAPKVDRWRRESAQSFRSLGRLVVELESRSLGASAALIGLHSEVDNFGSARTQETSLGTCAGGLDVRGPAAQDVPRCNPCGIPRRSGVHRHVNFCAYAGVQLLGT